MTVNVNKEIYGQLLMQVLPSVITDEQELTRLTEEVDRLMTKGLKRGLSPEEGVLLQLLARLIEDYEDEHYPIEDAPPHQVLKFIMEQRDLKQSDLLDIFGSSGIASEVVNGKRSISKTQAKKLAERFKVSVELFI
ncbi:MAG: transcriptional regulator [Acidobacteriota bacterium]